MLKYSNLVSAMLFSSLMGLTACSTEYDPSPYVGVYQSIPDANSYLQIKDIDGTLYFYTTQGVMEADLHGSNRYSLIDYYTKGKFEDLENGQYQRLINRDYAHRVEYKRVKDTSQLDLEHIHHGHLYGYDISTTQTGQCEKPFPFEITLSHNERLQRLWSDIEKGRYGTINSVLVAKDGQLIAEKYFNGYNKEEKQTVQSVSKSIVSLLAGSAIEEGYIPSSNSKVKAFFPNYSEHFTQGKEAIRFKHLLSMTAGWQWDEWSTNYSDPNNPRTAQMKAPDTIEYVIKLPLSHQPGEHFAYSGGVVDVAAELIKNATKKQSAADYFVQSRLKDLCISNASWLTMDDGRIGAGGGMLFRPRDMLKFGQLVLNEGQWQGKALLSPQWIEESTQAPHHDQQATYQYYWWNDALYAGGQQHRAVFASGWGDQSIYVFKNLGLVIVTTGFNFERGYKNRSMLEEHVLPAVL